MALTKSSLLVLVPSTSTTLLVMASSIHDLKETQLSMHLHDFTGGPNVKSLPVAGSAGKLWVFNQFGTAYVGDDIITEGPSPESAVVGRAQSLAVTSSLDGRDALVLLSIVFTNEKYNGSTIEIQGNYKQFGPTTEVAVVSGTGKFRFVRGYPIFGTYSYYQPSGYSVISRNVTVQHY